MISNAFGGSGAGDLELLVEQEQEICSYWWSRSRRSGDIEGAGDRYVELLVEQDLEIWSRMHSTENKKEAVQGLELELTQ